MNFKKFETKPKEEEAISKNQIFEGVRNTIVDIPKDENFVSVLHMVLKQKIERLDPELGAILENKLQKIDFAAEEDKLVEEISQILFEMINQRFTKQSLEEKLREAFINESGFIPLNEILSYGHYEDMVHIHLAPAKTLGPKQFARAVKEGLEELARLLQTDPDLQEVKTVEGTSWIVAKNPGLMEKLGFTIDGKINEEKRQRHFANENREVWASHIDKDDLIRLYGSK